MKEARISKTVRILSIFHLFRYCREVSYKEITDLLPVSTKTAERDIALLRRADIIHIRYARSAGIEGAFIPLEGDSAVCESPCPEPSSYEPEQLYLEKLIRLTTMMREMGSTDDPVQWYESHYPLLCRRTMQRDFKTLREVGYCIYYQREEDDAYAERKRGQYYCDFPYSTYGLPSFHSSF